MAQSDGSATVWVTPHRLPAAEKARRDERIAAEPPDELDDRDWLRQVLVQTEQAVEELALLQATRNDAVKLGAIRAPARRYGPARRRAEARRLLAVLPRAAMTEADLRCTAEGQRRTALTWLGTGLWVTLRGRRAERASPAGGLKRPGSSLAARGQSEGVAMKLRDRIRRWWSPAQWEDDHPTERKHREKPNRYALGGYFSNPAKNLQNIQEDYPRGADGIDYPRDFKKPR
jgi:hypothetical protein